MHSRTDWFLARLRALHGAGHITFVYLGGDPRAALERACAREQEDARRWLRCSASAEFGAQQRTSDNRRPYSARLANIGDRGSTSPSWPTFSPEQTSWARCVPAANQFGCHDSCRQTGAMTDPSTYPDWLTPWCVRQLGSPPATALLAIEQMSQVFGIVLADGREVLVKARPDENGRATHCVQAQRRLAAGGFPCAAPITPVSSVGTWAVHAEEWRPGGTMMRGDGPDVAEHFAWLLARLVGELEHIDVAPPLPNPPWVRWMHDGPGTWPPAGFLDERDQTLVPAYVEETARRATARLLQTNLPNVIGHADWETQNLRWHKTQPWAVHDWDSLAWMPEAGIAGAAAGTFASAEIPTLAPLESSAAFLDAYQQARARVFCPEEREVAWAASLWPAAHNARGQSLFERPPVAEAALRDQADARLQLAGA